MTDPHPPSSTPDSDELLDALRALTGRPDATFREGQREAIDALVTDRSRVLIVQRTGWGKSAVYFLTTHLLRKSGLGPTVLISPLLALMRNQIDAASRLGLQCQTINSASNTTVGQLESALREDTVDLLLISPERLANPEFARKIMPLIGAQPGLIVIDEVHCISDWGHDFRPDYRRIGRIVDDLAGTDVPILGCTATANDRVVHDVADQLGAEMSTFRGPLHREGLALTTLRLDRQAERLAWLADALPELPGSGIVYCLTVRDVETVARWLQQRGLSVLAYFGSLDPADRIAAEDKLQSNEIKALVATTALGMGYDKPDLGFVVHFQSPGSPVAYYQQVGRAGRALDESAAVLMRGLEDAQIQDYFIEHAFAAEHIVNDVVAELEQADGELSTVQMQTRLNMRAAALDSVLKQLDVDGVVERTAGTKYVRTPGDWEYPAERINAVTAARRAEQQSMIDYLGTTGCRMQFIAQLLDDDTAEPCGVCDNCAPSTFIERTLSVEAVAEAEAFLRSRPIEIAPRKQAIDAGGSRRKIPEEERAEIGRALSMWNDDGWGQLVREGRNETAVFDERLVDAAAAFVSEWEMSKPPVWITCVPSVRRPDLVQSFAERLADVLEIPFHDVLHVAEARPPQSEQLNSAHQQRNVEGAFVADDDAPTGPVLLIDDLVDSGWTLTEASRVLRRVGTGAVHPFALASMSGR